MDIFGRVLAVGQLPLIDPQVVAGTAPSWRAVVHDVSGVLFTVGSVVFLAVVFIGVILAEAGNLALTCPTQSRGVKVLIWGLVVAATFGSISGAMDWSTSGPSLVPVDPGISAAVGPVTGLSA